MTPPIDPIIHGDQYITYRRRAAPDEFDFGDYVYRHFPLKDVLRPGTRTTIKKWVKGPDGLRYWRI